ncbi:MAG: penicillin acylase family protein, partial [Spirochaetia bacterium]|nr:penicillin acylase family protein [Spirochaetia bacterium]
GQVKRLRRGNVDLPIGGGPDVMSAVHSEERGGHLVGVAGDSYVLLVEFTPAGARSWSVHQYGNINRPESPHYADQAALFAGRTLKATLRSEKEIRTRLESEYSPGAELK